MLLQNQSLLAQYPIRSLREDRALYSRTERRNLFVGVGLTSQLAGVPSGYLAPGSWNLPNKEGLGSSSGNLSTTTGSATGVQGVGGVASSDALSAGIANGIGTANGVANATSLSSGSATGIGLAFGLASGAAAATGNATQSAKANGSASGASSTSSSAITFATAWGTASTVTAELSVDDIAQAVMDSGIEGSFTLKEALRLILATTAGKVSGSSSPTITFRDINDTKDRVVATVSSGNRTSITYDVT